MKSMSYIRCLSNPEGLYVWSDGKFATLTHNVERPHSSGRSFSIPHRTFEALLKKWAKWIEPARQGGAVAEELHVEVKTGRLIPPWKPCRRCTPAGKNAWIPCRRCGPGSLDRPSGRYVIRLSYKGDFVNLWRVTWDYMVRRFL